MVLFLFSCGSPKKRKKVPSTNRKEADYVQLWVEQNGGQIEVRLNDRSRVDILTSKYAIEADFAHKWAEAIGQSLYYSTKTGKKAGVLLIMRKGSDKRSLIRFKTIVKEQGLPITLFILEDYQ